MDYEYSLEIDENKIQSCRVCLHAFSDNEIKMRVTPKVERNYKNLTSIQLLTDDNNPQFLCLSCNSKLLEYAEFRKQLIDNQKFLSIVERIDENEIYEETSETESPEMYQEEPIDYSTERLDVDDSYMDFDDNISQATVEFVYEHQDDITQEQGSNGNEKLPEQFPCSSCDKIFKHARSLADHVDKVHLKKRNFYCDICTYSSLRRYDMVRHVSRHIKKEYRSTYPCNLCCTSLVTKEGLKRHMKNVHSDVQKYSCDECEMKFALAGELKAHLKSVHGSHQYFGCPFCDKFFVTTNQLKKHKAVCIKLLLVAAQNSED